MLIHCRSRLGAAVAVGVVKLQRGGAMLTENACERGATIDLFGCVISHNSL
jgi:hypothetical protein